MITSKKCVNVPWTSIRSCPLEAGEIFTKMIYSDKSVFIPQPFALAHLWEAAGEIPPSATEHTYLLFHGQPFSLIGGRRDFSPQQQKHTSFCPAVNHSLSTCEGRWDYYSQKQTNAFYRPPWTAAFNWSLEAGNMPILSPHTSHWSHGQTFSHVHWLHTSCPIEAVTVQVELFVVCGYR
jgi:hypothetical protein